jgi:hypothetical protein
MKRKKILWDSPTNGCRPARPCKSSDDAALLCASTSEATLRLTRIAIASKQLADMQGSRPKTESMVTRRQPRLPLPTEPQIRETLGKKANICPNCDRAYSTAHGLKTHLTHGKDGCRWRHCCTDTEITRITDIRGGGDHLRFFAVPTAARSTRSGSAGVSTNWIPEPILRQHPGGPAAIDAFYESPQCCGFIWANDMLYKASMLATA